jgi:hypothetical protein
MAARLATSKATFADTKRDKAQGHELSPKIPSASAQGVEGGLGHREKEARTVQKPVELTARGPNNKTIARIRGTVARAPNPNVQQPAKTKDKIVISGVK